MSPKSRVVLQRPPGSFLGKSLPNSQSFLERAGNGFGMTAQSTKTKKWAAAGIATVGVIHLVLAPEYFSEQAYIGVLFVAGAVVCGYVAAKLWTGREVARDWTLGALTAAGM